MRPDDPMTGAARRQNPAPAGLDGSLSALVDEAKALRADVRNAEQARQRAERARRRASQVNLAGLALVAALVGLLLVVAWSAVRTNARIADCTTAGGACYEEGGRRTGTAIADIIRAQMFVSECARQWPGEVGPTYDVKLERCVAERLAAQAAAPPAVPVPAPSVSSGG